jgi:hypothetical protein
MTRWNEWSARVQLETTGLAKAPGIGREALKLPDSRPRS